MKMRGLIQMGVPVLVFSIVILGWVQVGLAQSDVISGTEHLTTTVDAGVSGAAQVSGSPTAEAQAAAGTIVPAGPTPNFPATVVALEQELGKQALEIETLRRDTEQSLEDFKWNLDKMRWWAAVLVASLGALGLLSYKYLQELAQKLIKRSVRPAVDDIKHQINDVKQEVSWLSPRYYRISLPESLDEEYRQLKAQGFNNLVKYTNLGADNLKGITVVQFQDEADEQDYVAFVQATAPDPSLVGFVLYKNGVLKRTTLSAFENSRSANMRTTMLDAIETIGRRFNFLESPVAKKGIEEK